MTGKRPLICRISSMPRRAHEVNRFEGFSDAVFGFALTLLVVQLEVPRTSDALVELVRGSVPFAITFAMVCYIWWEHNQFFRLYGLQDAWTAFLNSVLLFVVLFYVYPLKFLATALLSPLVGGARVVGEWDSRFVMLTYSTGVALIFGTFVMLYSHAWRRRHALELDPSDAHHPALQEARARDQHEPRPGVDCDRGLHS